MSKQPEERAYKKGSGGEFIELSEGDMLKLGLAGFKPLPMTRAAQRAAKQDEKDARRARTKERRAMREAADPSYGAPADKLKPVENRKDTQDMLLKTPPTPGRKKLPPLKGGLLPKLDGGGAARGKKVLPTS